VYNNLKKSHGNPRVETGQEDLPMSQSSREELEAFILSVLPEPPVDFEIQNHFSIFLLCPITDAAINWVEKFLPEDVLKFGGGIVVEPRYIGPIAQGIKDAGLAVR